MQTCVIYTDGATSKTDRSLGGWGYVVVLPNGDQIKDSGSARDTTMRRMDLTAVIRALSAIPSQFQRFPTTVITHSDIVYQGMKEWIDDFKAKNFVDISDGNLWRALDILTRDYCSGIKWVLVKGHDSDPVNEMAGALANKALSQLCAGYIEFGTPNSSGSSVVVKGLSGRQLKVLKDALEIYVSIGTGKLNDILTLHPEIKNRQTERYRKSIDREDSLARMQKAQAALASVKTAMFDLSYDKSQNIRSEEIVDENRIAHDLFAQINFFFHEENSLNQMKLNRGQNFGVVLAKPSRLSNEPEIDVQKCR